MASGKELRRRITSVKNTQQITRAMKMVSAAKLRRAQEAIVQARPYAKEIKKVVQSLTDSSGEETNPFLSLRKVKKVNVLLFTSDKGLCGGFNTNLNKAAERFYKEEAGKYEKFVFTCFGKKGAEYLLLRNIPVEKKYFDFYKKLNFAKVSVIVDELIDSFLQKEFDEIHLIYAEFKSALSQVVRRGKLLPVDFTQEEQKISAVGGDIIYEPRKEEILKELLPRYFKTVLYKGLLESIASEHGARMAAMDSASTNASDVIRKLTLAYNNVRQAGITNELLEITAGAEAL